MHYREFYFFESFVTYVPLTYDCTVDEDILMCETYVRVMHDDIYKFDLLKKCHYKNES